MGMIYHHSLGMICFNVTNEGVKYQILTRKKGNEKGMKEGMKREWFCIHLFDIINEFTSYTNFFLFKTLFQTMECSAPRL